LIFFFATFGRSAATMPPSGVVAYERERTPVRGGRAVRCARGVTAARSRAISPPLLSLDRCRTLHTSSSVLSPVDSSESMMAAGLRAGVPDADFGAPFVAARVTGAAALFVRAPDIAGECEGLGEECKM
jgi:hypothetical protein